ncbi:AAA domain-containing protein [Catalinimonas alkaloidigena]|uniref:AAA domain-containing protein n=1 Tax=Catalinimonas alkaloidigena TaxID=1075417 RepID=A0A1G8WWZ0_9BACT|nr:DEAD/DEAH box helicase [Catalinimonas alkaloidigena]SDJ82587.1 AAA domain-containing protein [Catalinimonas alkaloidigena]
MNTITPQSLIDYIYQETAAGLEGQLTNQLITLEGLEEDGVILSNLRLVGCDLHTATFRYTTNLTKFKMGDQVILTDGQQKIKVEVVGMDATTITLRAGYGERFDGLSSQAAWRLEEVPFDMGWRVAKLIRERLMPGSAGWPFFSTLFYQRTPTLPPDAPDEATVRQQVDAFLAEHQTQLNPSQYRAVCRSVQRPGVFAVQGPPGTGKTKVLSVIAHVLAESGFRVAIVAHTHQAVNHALTEIKALHPERDVVKIGDPLKALDLPSRLMRCRFREFERLWRSGDVQHATVTGFSFYSALFALARDEAIYRPDVVLIDEASQMPLALGALTGTLGAPSVLLFGDPKQMPPIFQEELGDHALSVSILEHIARHHPDHFTPLDITYRMNRRLTELVGDLFYRDAQGVVFLKPGDWNRARTFRQLSVEAEAPLDQLLAPDVSFAWVRSPGRLHRQTNPYEADLTARLIGTCLRGGLTPHDVAVVTPYRRQIVAIGNQLHKQYPDLRHTPIIDTVERVQGQSVELVIVSYATSDPDYIADVSEFLFSAPRLNVAISRAKTKVIFLCADTILTSVPATLEGLRTQQHLRQLREKACLVL